MNEFFELGVMRITSKFKPRAHTAGKAVSKAVLFAGLLALSSCTSLIAPPAPDTYDITAPTTFPGLKGGSRAQILILEPSALKVLDSLDIVIKPNDAVVQYLAKAQWTDRLPKVVQARLIESFENTGRVRAVAKPGEGLVIDYQIVSDIRAFQADLGNGTSQAVVSISVKLVSDRTGKVIRAKVFSKGEPLASSSPIEVVTTLDEAFDDVARQIVSWVFAGV
ncbi:MAG: ABC-type transport auxiliary lipoprotein family protein [Nitratireductor sp.]